jgi:uncharacterized membrane protein
MLNREDVYVLSFAALVALIGYAVFVIFGPQCALSLGLSASLFLIGAKLYRTEVIWSKLLGALIIAAGAGVFTTMMLGPFAGAVASLLALIYFLVRILQTPEAEESREMTKPFEKPSETKAQKKVVF